MIKSGQYLLVVGYVKPNTSLLSAVLSYGTDWIKNLACNVWFVQTCEFALPPPLSLMAYCFAYEREMYQILQKMFKSHISATRTKVLHSITFENPKTWTWHLFAEATSPPPSVVGLYAADLAAMKVPFVTQIFCCHNMESLVCKKSSGNKCHPTQFGVTPSTSLTH